MKGTEKEKRRCRKENEGSCGNTQKEMERKVLGKEESKEYGKKAMHKQI